MTTVMKVIETPFTLSELVDKKVFITLNVLYHTVAHELHGAGRHNQTQFEELCLITFFEMLPFVLPVPSTNKDNMNT